MPGQGDPGIIRDQGAPVQSPGSCLREPCPQEAAELSRNRVWMAGWAWGPSELTGGLGSGPRRAPAPLPHPAPSVSVSGKGPRRRGPCPGPLTRPGCVGAASGVGHGRALSTSSPLCSQMPAPTVRGVSQAAPRPQSAGDGHSLNPRPSTPPCEGPEASPGSGAVLQCSPGDTLPGPQSLHHNYLAGS